MLSQMDKKKNFWTVFFAEMAAGAERMQGGCST